MAQFHDPVAERVAKRPVCAMIGGEEIPDDRKLSVSDYRNKLYQHIELMKRNSRPPKESQRSDRGAGSEFASQRGGGSSSHGGRDGDYGSRSHRRDADDHGSHSRRAAFGARSEDAYGR